MAPGVPLVVADSETPFAVLDTGKGINCPLCGHHEKIPPVSGKGKRKKISLSLLVHPDWLAGEAGSGPDGTPYGGSVTDGPESTAAWNRARASRMRLIEVRGALPAEITCPETGATIRTDKAGGTVPKKSAFACGSCGAVQDILTAVKATGKSGPVAAYAVQGYCPSCDSGNQAYGGRFFAVVDDTSAFDIACREWDERREADLSDYWPRSELPFGFMTHMNNGGIPNHGYTHWWTMFNARQLLMHAQLLRAVACAGGEVHSGPARETVLAAYTQVLRYQCMFCIWQAAYDKMIPHFSQNNFHPKSNMVEGNVFSGVGAGNYDTLRDWLRNGREWAQRPWEVVTTSSVSADIGALTEGLSGKSVRAYTEDPILAGQVVEAHSATELCNLPDRSFDLVVTDPPFGGNLHYAELSDFFYVWLRLALVSRYPELFGPPYTPKALEAVENKARQPQDPKRFYQRLLTESWSESSRILKPGGLLSFTFHHSEDAPWVAVLESLFDAGFYLEATYPIRSDETKGEGSKPGTFGSQKIEYDIIHVCRKRMVDPTPVSWAKMRREVLTDVRQLQALLEHHQNAGLYEADLQVIRRGKALEYFSRHYGKVYVDEGKPITVEEALVGINQLLDEEAGGVSNPPPVTAEPFTRQFLRLFDGRVELPRDQMQKYLRGTGVAPSEFEQRGWCKETKKVFHLVPPLEIARFWQGRHRRKMASDYDQAAFLIGACFDNSGINVNETLNNENFRPHPALGALLEWFSTRGGTTEIRNAASRAGTILRSWKDRHEQQVQQMSLFFDDMEKRG